MFAAVLPTFSLSIPERTTSSFPRFGDTVRDLCQPWLFLAQEVVDLKTIALHLELNRKVAVYNLHPVLVAPNDTPDHVLCVSFKRAAHGKEPLLVRRGRDDNTAILDPEVNLREAHIADQSALRPGDGGAHRLLA